MFTRTATEPYPDPRDSSPQPPPYFFKIHCNITLHLHQELLLLYIWTIELLRAEILEVNYRNPEQHSNLAQ
jgi:hypothetical protein